MPPGATIPMLFLRSWTPVKCVMTQGKKVPTCSPNTCCRGLERARHVLLTREWFAHFRTREPRPYYRAPCYQSSWLENASWGSVCVQKTHTILMSARNLTNHSTRLRRAMNRMHAPNIAHVFSYQCASEFLALAI